MKDLDKNVVYNLSDLNIEERSELFDYLLSVDETYKGSKNEFKIPVKDFIRYDFCNNVWDWEYWGSESESSKIEIKNKPTINAKTLFDPKVNIINPTESNCDKTIENLVGRIIQCKTNELTSFTKNDCYVVLENNTNNSKLPYCVKDDDYTIRGTEHYIGNDFIDKYFELVNEWKSKQGDKVCIKDENHNCDENIEKDSILEVILKNKLLELRENVTDLENLLLHNTNLNDFSKTEMMKTIIFINRQSDVLNEVLKDYEIEKLKQQCEN